MNRLKAVTLGLALIGINTAAVGFGAFARMPMKGSKSSTIVPEIGAPMKRIYCAGLSSLCASLRQAGTVKCAGPSGRRDGAMRITKWLVGFLLLASNSAWAAYDYTGIIAMVYSGPDYGGKVFIQVAASPAGSVACDVNGTFDFAFDATTAAGKIVFSSILTAYATGGTIRLTSKDVCTLFAGIPDLDTFSLK